MRSNLKLDRAARAVGTATPTIFVASFLIQGLRPDYNWLSQFVSELAIGEYGSVQMVTFMLTGLGYACLGVLLKRGNFASWFSAVCLVVIGVGLFVSAFFVTDPSGEFVQPTAHGFIHGLVGAVVFSLFPATCFVFSRSIRARGHRLAARITVLIGILLVAGIILLKYSEVPNGVLFEWRGLVQRSIIVVFMGWTAAMAIFQTRGVSAMSGRA